MKIGYMLQASVVRALEEAYGGPATTYLSGPLSGAGWRHVGHIPNRKL